MMIVRAAFASSRMRHGRHTIHSISVAYTSRKATAPDAPTTGIKVLANAAPVWKPSMARIRTAIGRSMASGDGGIRWFIVEFQMLHDALQILANLVQLANADRGLHCLFQWLQRIAGVMTGRCHVICHR